MHIVIKYFASLRETLGRESENLDVSATMTVASLRELLCRRDANYAAAFAPDVLLHSAVDQTVVTSSHGLHDGAEVAFFPPVTGG